MLAGDLRQLKGLTAADVWTYYCHHMDVVKIVAWIDAQFSDEPAASASVPDWPLTEPVSADMIAQLHDACPDRVANYLLDRLARYAFTYTHTRLMALSPGLPGTRKAKPIWILLKQESVSGSGVSWAIPHKKHDTKLLPITSPDNNRFSNFF